MAAVTMTLHLDDAGFRALLARARSLDLTGAMKQVGEVLLNRVAESFRSESSPEGRKWKPLKASTIAERLRLGYGPGPILRREGWLAEHFSYRASRDRVLVGTAVPYAAIHQFGGRAGRGHRAVIPARPFLGVAPEDWDEIREILLREALRQLC